MPLNLATFGTALIGLGWFVMAAILLYFYRRLTCLHIQWQINLDDGIA